MPTATFDKRIVIDQKDAGFLVAELEQAPVGPPKIETSFKIVNEREEMSFMNFAKLTASGQITVPMEIRRLLNVKPGDKILFVQNENGDIVIENASINAIRKAQKAFEGVAEGLGFPDEDTIQLWVDEVRYGKDE